MNILKNEELITYVKNLRRYFHMHPELSGKEFETTKRIALELDSLNIKYTYINERTIVAEIGEGDIKIALRADSDALPIVEEGDKEYISKNSGVMHACGHDGHVSMLLGAAKYLKTKEEELNGKIYLCFQPAEEIGEGAIEVLDFLEKNGGVNQVFGIHLWSLIPVGKVAATPGARMASGDGFSIKIFGRGGHGSRPDQCVDPLKIGAKILLEITSIPCNRISTLDNSVVSVGIFNGGSAGNIIPNEAFIQGGYRTFTQEARTKIPNLIKEIAENIANYHGGKIEFNSLGGVPCVYNHKESVEIAQNTITKLLGKDALYDFEPLCASENFGFYTEKYPGMMAFVGAGNEEKGIIYPHHHPKFDIDEDALINGTMLYAQYAIDFLNKELDSNERK